MNNGKELQLEKIIDDAIKGSTFKGLEELQDEGDEIVSCKCNKQMAHKLNILILRELNKKEVKNAGLLLSCIHKYGKHMIIEGEDGLAAMIKEGLVQKMVPWFEKARKIWDNNGKRKNDALTNFAEDFFDALITILNHNKEGRCQVLDMFLHRIGSLVTDDHVNVYIQEEAIRKMNMILNTMSREDRKGIQLSSKMQLLMNDFGKRILDAGDYNLQVAITESLCRMTSEAQRQELTNNWFPMEFVVDAFKRIKDSEFETDCRRFLNQVNGMLGEKTSVSTFPCLKVFLDNCELQMPSDDKVEEFWIDFNVGSQSISFYVVTEEDENEPMWETVSLPEEDVESYTIEVKNEKKLLAIDMNIPVRVGNSEGTQIQIFFDLTLDILNVVMKVYPSTKHKRSSRKDRISEVKTAVHVIFDGSSSQALLAESQLSSPNNKETGSEKIIGTKVACLPRTDTDFEQATVHPTEPIVAHRQKTSEVSMIVSSTERITRDPGGSIAVNSTPAKKSKMKPPLEMKNSSGRNNTYKVGSDKAEPGNSIHLDLPEKRSTHKLMEKKSTQKITASKVIEILQEEDERKVVLQTMLQGRLDEIVPDSQPVVLKQKPLLPGLSENIHKDQMCFSKKRCWISDSPASSCSTVERKSACMKYAFQQGDQILKHQTFCSTFDEKSPRKNHQNEFQNLKNGAVELQLQYNLEKETSAEKHEKNGTYIKDNHNKAKFIENMASEMDNFKFDEISHNFGSEKQNNPKSNNGSERYKTDLTCKNQPRKPEYGVKKNTITETMINAIAAKYTDETKKKHLNKDVHLSIRYQLDELHDQKKLKDKKQTWKGQKGIDRTVNVKNKMKNGVLDVYSFDGSSTVEPTISLRVKNNKMPQQTFSDKRKSEKTNKKHKPAKKEEIHKSTGHVNKKYFFTDTETDGKTEISWLQESNRKTKPKLVAYSRQRKQNMPHNLDKGKVTTSVRSHSAKKSKGKMKSIEKINSKKIPAEKKQRNCPRRAAATQPCYKEVSESASDSSEEVLSLANQRKSNLTMPVPAKKICKDYKEKETMPAHYTQHKEISDVSTLPSDENTSVEKMRYERMCKPVTLSTSRSSSPPESEPSIQRESSLESLQSPNLSMKFTKPYKSAKGILKTETPLSSPYYSTAKPTFSCDFSPAVSPISQVTSLRIEINEMDDVQQEFVKWKNPDGDIVANKNLTSENSIASTGSSNNFTLNSLTTKKTTTKVTPLRIEINKMDDVQQEFVKWKYPDEDIVANKCQSSENSVATTGSSNNFTQNSLITKKTSPKETLSRSATPVRSRRGEKDRVSSTESHTAGPTCNFSVFKCIYGKNLQNNFSDVEEEEETTEQQSNLKPRKLFGCDFGNQNSYRDPNLLSNNIGGSSVKQIDHWGKSEPNIGDISQKFSKELKVKFQRHSQRIDRFTKFNLKSVQQRMSSTSVQIYGYRLQRLNKFQAIIMQEMQQFEKDSLALKCMEKELSNFWKQHSKAFSELKENEEERIQHLRSSFENNVCHSVELEERVFRTEMHLMRKEMKTIQDRLLKEMQEEELVTVHRGLQSFFLSGSTPF
ncbi:synaptonemal complex protein 2 isoform X2 [Narcine bancroftii]|uniref:synaptonemal complex protein 2 isoform X2 n=1 Tax=Narcine bancroftii TaxID=1343680 RepID=UPI00383230D5